MVTALASQTDADAPSKDRLRLWIRLLRAAHTIEAELREKLKSEFGSTLPRFDVMSALHRQPDGMLMTDLSRYLLVSNGNVTGIIDRLVSDGFVQRSWGHRSLPGSSRSSSRATACGGGVTAVNIRRTGFEDVVLRDAIADSLGNSVIAGPGLRHSAAD